MSSLANAPLRRVKAIEAGCSLLIAAIVIADGLQFILNPSRNLRAVEVGGYEILIGGVLGALALVYALGKTPAEWEPVDRSHVTWVSYSLLIAYGLCLHNFGYLLASFVAVAAYMRLLGGYNLLTSVLAAASFALGSTWLWTTMQVNLPSGMFGTWLFW